MELKIANSKTPRDGMAVQDYCCCINWRDFEQLDVQLRSIFYNEIVKCHKLGLDVVT